MNGEGWHRFAHAVVLCLAFAGCREDSRQRLADAEIYVRSACMAFRLDPPDDPCLGPRTELARCYAERETCDDYFDLVIPGGPGTICEEFVQLALECIVEHEDEIDANASQGGT